MTPAVPAPTMSAPAPSVIALTRRPSSCTCRVAGTMSASDFAMKINCEPRFDRPTISFSRGRNRLLGICAVAMSYPNFWGTIAKYNAVRMKLTKNTSMKVTTTARLTASPTPLGPPFA